MLVKEMLWLLAEAVELSYRQRRAILLDFLNRLPYHRFQAWVDSTMDRSDLHALVYWRVPQPWWGAAMERIDLLLRGKQ